MFAIRTIKKNVLFDDLKTFLGNNSLQSDQHSALGCDIKDLFSHTWQSSGRISI